MPDVDTALAGLAFKGFLKIDKCPLNKLLKFCSDDKHFNEATFEKSPPVFACDQGDRMSL
jgi:hypothetical protein